MTSTQAAQPSNTDGLHRLIGPNRSRVPGFFTVGGARSIAAATATYTIRELKPLSYAATALIVLAAVAGGRFLLSSMRGELVAPAEAKTLVDNGALLVDVRSTEEFAGGHIDGAKNIPVGTVAANLAAFGQKDEPIVVYCRSGVRSGRAKSVLEDNGFTHVHNLGAMGNW